MISFNQSGFIQNIRAIEELYHNKYATKAAVGIIRTLWKALKIKDSEIERTQKEFKDTQNDDYWKDLMMEVNKRRDMDDYDYDDDPFGFNCYFTYVRLLSYFIVQL